MNYKIYWLSVYALIFLDFMTTWYGVGTLGLAETNPLMQTIVTNLPLFIIIKLIAQPIILLVIWIFMNRFSDLERKPKARKINEAIISLFEHVLIIILLAVVVNNIVNIISAILS